MESKDDPWSFKKFFAGFFKIKNAGKAIVLMFWMAIILTVSISVYSFVRSKVAKPTTAVGTNSGVINNEDKHGHSFSLFNIVNSR